MSAVCPAGHTSTADDYCDVCGMPVDPAAVTPEAPTQSGPETTASPAAEVHACPNCATDNARGALFCENCGYDFTTGAMPRPMPDSALGSAKAIEAADETGSAESGAAPATAWVAEVWIDPAWYEAQQSPDPMPSPGPPEVIALRSTSLLLGRTSQSRNIHPEIDCDADSGVSRRQTQLTTDGVRWFAEDLDSANGTFVAPATGPLPSDPIPVGTKRELAADDRVYVGAWTRLVIRAASPEEIADLG